MWGEEFTIICYICMTLVLRIPIMIQISFFFEKKQMGALDRGKNTIVKSIFSSSACEFN